MYFDVAAASSLLAFFVSTKNPHQPQQHHHSPANNLHSAFVPRTADRIPTRPFGTSLHSDSTAGMAQAVNDKNLMVPVAVKQEKYVALLEWLSSQGATVNDCLQVQKSSQGEQAGYGVFVSQPVTEGDLLFSIPRNLCVTIEKATNSVDDDGTFGEGMKTLIEKAGPGGSTVAMAGYMAKEYILMYLDQMDGNENNSVSDDTNSGSSRWGPYMELLPWKRGINNQEHVLFWNEAKIEDLLKGSMCYSEARSLREEVALSITVLGPLLKRSVRMAKGDLSTSPLERFQSLLPWQQFQNPTSPDEDLSLILDDKLVGDAIKGAFVTLLTRSFADDDDDDDELESADGEDDATPAVDPDAYSEKLVPLLDLLQHSDAPNVRHKVVGSGSDARVEVRARADIAPGSELWNQYRSEEEEAMPYSRFFTRFGFVPGIDEPIENLLIDKSPIFYPQKAEV